MARRAQFYAMAAQMMRAILSTRRVPVRRRSAAVQRESDIDETAVLSPAPDRSILALDEALTALSRLRRGRRGSWSCAILAG